MMEIKQRNIDKVLIIELSGRLDASSAPLLSSLVNKNLDQAPLNMIIGMDAVDFIDSTGLSNLIVQLKHCREHNGNLVLYGIRQTVRIIFELTRLDKVFNIFLNEEEALIGLIPQNSTN
jgi:anti-sigma B factor antagonist